MTEREIQACKRTFTLDDLGTVRLFAGLYKDRICYISEYKSFFAYEDGVWVQDKCDLITRHYAKKFSDEMASAMGPYPTNYQDKMDDNLREERDFYMKYRSFNQRKILVNDLQDEIRKNASLFDSQPHLLNCKNGTLNLETMELQKHNPNDFLSKMANVIYDPRATCKRFDEFISEICNGSAERAFMLQKVLGYALKGEANEECYFTAIGSKTRNGKGTLFDTVLNIMGSYGAQIDFSSLTRGTAKDGSRATPDLARLIGARFVLANEPEQGVSINEALLKQITGNDDIVARPLYAEPIQFKPVFKLYVTANLKPSVSDDSLFASGRIKLLPFDKYFSQEERDTNLKAKFRTEEAKSGILNWLMRGYFHYLEDGIDDTPEMAALTKSYRDENDYFSTYLNEYVDLTADGKITLKALRQSYSIWCEQTGTKACGLHAFKDELTKHDIKIDDSSRLLMINGAFISTH